MVFVVAGKTLGHMKKKKKKKRSMGVATPGGLGGSTGAWQLIHPTRTYLYLLDSQSGCRCTERLRLIMCGNVGVQAPIESNMRQPMDRSKPPLVHSFVCRATIPRLLSWGSNGIDTYVDISIALPKAKKFKVHRLRTSPVASYTFPHFCVTIAIAISLEYGCLSVASREVLRYPAKLWFSF